MEVGEEEDVQERPGVKHHGKIYRRCESVGVVFAEWPVIEVDGNVSSPNASAGVGASKSKQESFLIFIVLHIIVSYFVNHESLYVNVNFLI